MKIFTVLFIVLIQVGCFLPVSSKEIAVNTPKELMKTRSSGWWDCTVAPFKTVHVNSSNALSKAIKRAKPGTEIIVADGQYAFHDDLTIKSKGNKCQPIVIKAKNIGKASVTKGNILFKNTAWVTFEGFTVNSTINKNNSPLIISDSEYLRLSRINFDIQGDKKSKWVHIKASSNIRVDHSEFQGRAGPGSYIYAGNPSKLINIDHNYFHDRAKIGGNGGESIYFHGKHGHRWDMDSIIEYNLFKNLDAEWELIGIKSHQNIIRYNTFIDNQGTVSIRGGDYNKVYGNYFLNYTSKPTAAIRIHGYFNKVFNNYAFGLTKTFIETYWGDRDIPYLSRSHRLTWWEKHNNTDAYTIQETAYRKSSKNLIASNTIINSNALFFWSKKCLNLYENIADKKRTFVDKNTEYVIYPPDHWVVANNLVINANKLVTEDFVKRGNMPCSNATQVHEKNFSWVGNIIHNDRINVELNGSRMFSHKQWRVHNPKKNSTSMLGVYKLTDLAPATDFPLLIGEFETDIEIHKQLNHRDFIGAQLNTPPLTVFEVGPLSP